MKRKRVPVLLAGLFAVFAIGLTASLVIVRPAVAQQGDTATSTVVTDTTASTTIGTTTSESGGETPSANGSTLLFAVLVLGLATFFATPYLIDVIWTHKRWDNLLNAAKSRPGGLTADDVREFAEKAPTGVEGLSRSIMAFSVIGVLGAGLFYVLVKTPTSNSGAIVSNLLATLGTLATAIIAFYFGTRAGQTGAGGDGTPPTPPAPPPPPVTPPPPAVPANTKLPTIVGDPVAAGVLTAYPGVWTNEPTSYEYVWQREGGADAWSTIGAGDTYQLGPDDSGHRVRLCVTAANAVGASNVVASDPVSAS